MAFTRWDPLRDLLAMQQRIDRLAEAGDAGWTPPVDLYETLDRYVLTAELPGLCRADLDIQFLDGQLQIRGERPSSCVACEQYHRVERGRGPFLRRFALPAAVDADAITADLKDGVLTVTIPKAAGAVPRRIDVT